MRCVIFDIDGTLFDTKEGIIEALNDTVGIFGGERIGDEEADKYIGPPVFDSFINYRGYEEEKAREATQYYRQVYVDKYVKNSVMYDGVIQVLELLKQAGDSIAIATMKTWPQVEKLLKANGVFDYFDVIKCAADDGSLTKSNMVAQIRSEINVEKYIVVGDTYSDYKAAVENGADFIFAEYGYGKCEEAERRILDIKKIDSL